MRSFFKKGKGLNVARSIKESILCPTDNATFCAYMSLVCLQACAYKVGEIKIKELRRKAEQKLGKLEV